MAHEILDGLTVEDFIAFPDENCVAGAVITHDPAEATEPWRTVPAENSPKARLWSRLIRRCPDDGNVVETLPIGEDTVGQDPEPVVDPSQDAGQTAPTSGSGLRAGDLAVDPAETGTASGGNLVR